MYSFVSSFHVFAQKYLKEYHYLSNLKSGNHNFRDALRMFQQNSDIPDTGLLDAKTITEMHKPRCGVPDFDEGGSTINPGKDIMAVEWVQDYSNRVEICSSRAAPSKASW